MDLVNGFLNIVAPPFTLFTMLLFLPPWIFFRFCHGLLRIVFPEDLSGKVVLITGASSGIGEHMAYEYARKGARLALAARREDRLREVADRCREIGGSCHDDVLVIRADVSEPHDCKRMVDQTLHHFHRLDHLVNNAGISHFCLLEDTQDITTFRPVMDINFWGSVYTTKFAAPHLRDSGGRIIVLSSVAAWAPTLKMSVYNASKAALLQFYETLRVEFGGDVKITIVTPGFIESEITQGKFLSREGKMRVNYNAHDTHSNILLPVGKVETCAREIVKRAMRGDRYVTEPGWMKMVYVCKVLWPEALDWICRLLYVKRIPGGSHHDTIEKKITGAQKLPHPTGIQSPEMKSE